MTPDPLAKLAAVVERVEQRADRAGNADVSILVAAARVLVEQVAYHDEQASFQAGLADHYRTLDLGVLAKESVSMAGVHRESAARLRAAIAALGEP